MMPASTSSPSRALSRYSIGEKCEALIATAAFSVSRMHRWITDQIIEDIPCEIAVCEFDCRKTQCSSAEWETCERRTGAPGQPPQKP